jgi:DHA2 family multidrug resistance protein
LVRNLGSSIGIALVQTLLIRNTQAMHATLVQNITPDKLNPASATLGPGFDLSTLAGLATVSQEIERQATMVGYVDDFWMMFILTLAIIPLVLLIKPMARMKHRSG